MSLRMGAQSKKVYALLTERNLRFPDQPDDEMPRLPRDIDAVGDSDLMRLFSQTTAWTDYLSAQVVVAAIDEREAERDLAFIQAEQMLKGEEASGRVTFARAASATSQEVLEATARLDRIHAYRKMIEVLATSMERDAALISRELTRRTASSVAPSHRSSQWHP